MRGSRRARLPPRRRRRARRRASASARLGAWPKHDGDLRFAPGRERELAAEGRHAPSVVARARRRSRPSRPSRASGCCGPGRRRTGRGWSRSPGSRRLVAAKAKPRSKSLCGFWKRSVEPTVSSRILSTLSFGLSSSARSKKGATRRRFGLGAAIAQGQEAHVARIVGRDEDDVFDRRDRRACREMSRRPARSVAS